MIHLSHTDRDKDYFTNSLAESDTLDSQIDACVWELYGVGHVISIEILVLHRRSSL